MTKHTLRTLLACGMALLILLSSAGCGSQPEVSEPEDSATSAVPTAPTAPDSTTAAGTDPSATETGSTTENTTAVTTTGNTVKVTTTVRKATTATKATGGNSTTANKTTNKPVTTTTQPQKTEVKGQTKISDYIPDADTWLFEGFPMWGDFTLQLQFHGYQPYNQVLVENSMRAYGLADTLTHFTHNVETYEWASNHLIGESILVRANPSTREEALNMVLDWLAEQYADTAHPWAAMESFTRWQHYAGEAGYDYLGCEIGASVNCSNLSVAFVRGASKQFNSQNGDGNVDAWFVDFSLWGEGGMVNYSVQNPNMYKTQDGYHNNVGSGPLYGQSTSATRRAYYMAYMAGANWIISEAGGQAAFYDTITEEGLYDLSPHGEVFQDFYDFSQRHSDRGVTYTPFAVMIPRDYGLPYGHWKSTYKPFDVFQPNDGDYMLESLIQMIYPDSFPGKPKYEVGQQASTPYGDTFDFLTQTANQDVMNSYPVIILAGNLQISEYEKTRLYNYVGQGGILVMNTVYNSQLPSLAGVQTFGKGQVLSYGSDYSLSGLDSILSDLTTQLLPVKVDGTIEYLVNIKDGSVVVTLINNLGVEKQANQPTSYDNSQTQTVTVTYTGDSKLLEVRDWMTDSNLSANKTQTLVLGPGDIEVIEFVV